MIAKRCSTIDASGIRKVFNLAANLKDPINLSIGQPDFDIPDELKQIAINSIQEGFNKYTVTAGIPELNEGILKMVKTHKNREFEDCFVTGGVSGGLLLSLLTLVDPGDEVIFADPYFVSYKHLINFIGGIPKPLDTYPDFTLKKDKLEKLISSKTKLIMINSPNNPTGIVNSKEELEQVVEVAKKHNIYILTDEIYDAFIFDNDTPYFSISSIYENTILLGGFSKSHAMTGWRIGYVCTNKKLINEMIKIQQYTFVCAPSFAQKAALKALDISLADKINEYKIKRDIIFNGLDKKFNLVKPKGAFYAFPEVPKGYKNDTEFVEEAIKRNVLIIPGSVFSEKNTHFRISFANNNEQLKKGVEILNQMIK